MKTHRPSRPVTLILRRRVRPSCRGAFEAALRRLVSFSLSTKGQLDVHVLWRVDHQVDDYIVVHRFVDAAGRQEFTCSAEYRHWLGRLRDLTEESPVCPELAELAFDSQTSETPDPETSRSPERSISPRGHPSETQVTDDKLSVRGPSAMLQGALLVGMFLSTAIAVVLYALALGWEPFASTPLSIAVGASGMIAAVFCAFRRRGHSFRQNKGVQAASIEPTTKRLSDDTSVASIFTVATGDQPKREIAQRELRASIRF